MINTINPEYTRQALQTKYGDPNGFVYKQAKPIYLMFNVASFTTDPDYIFIQNVLIYSALVGVFTCVVDQNFVGKFTMNIDQIEESISQTFNVQAGNATVTNPPNIVAPFQMPILFQNIIIIKNSGAPVSAITFYGFYFERNV